jgi:hypothetical protein
MALLSAVHLFAQLDHSADLHRVIATVLGVNGFPMTSIPIAMKAD